VGVGLGVRLAVQVGIAVLVGVGVGSERRMSRVAPMPTQITRQNSRVIKPAMMTSLLRALLIAL